MTAVEEAFKGFEKAIKAGEKPAVGVAFQTLLRASEVTRSDIVEAGLAGKATVDRWFHGTTVPHPSGVRALKRFILTRNAVSKDDGVGYKLLTDRRYKPLLELALHLMEKPVEGRLLEERVNDLIFLMERSQGAFTKEMLCTFLGVEMK